MGVFFRKNIFTLSVTLLTVISLILIRYAFADTAIVAEANLTPLAYFFRVLFVVTFCFIGLNEFLQADKKLTNLFTLRSLLILSIILSLVLSITYPAIGYYVAVYFCVLLFSISCKKESYML